MPRFHGTQVFLYPPGNDHISHLRKRKIIFKSALVGDNYVGRVNYSALHCSLVDGHLFVVDLGLAKVDSDESTVYQLEVFSSARHVKLKRHGTNDDIQKENMSWTKCFGIIFISATSEVLRSRFLFIEKKLLQRNIIFPSTKQERLALTPFHQWLFLVPLKGGIGSI